MMTNFYTYVRNKLASLDFLALLAIRLYLAPVFIVAGLNKLNSFDSTVSWFGNEQWGLGLPFPMLMVTLAIIAELGGGIALAFGVLTRVFAFLLSITMAVAAFAVHWDNGWSAIASSDASSHVSSVFAALGIPSAEQSVLHASDVAERLQRARGILQEYGNYDWLTETGSFVILNNGIEFAVTYMIMLAVLLCYGAGKWLSVDYWMASRHNKL